MEEKIQELQEALNKNQAVVLATNCEITYSGRAEAFLPLGERLIIIKQDKTLLVHQPEGNNPVNYMKPNSAIMLRHDENAVFIHATNLAQKEYLDIKCKDIMLLRSLQLRDGQKLELAGSEKDMAEMIYKQPSLISDDFTPVSTEEQTKYGFIDVFGHDKEGNLVIVECKRYTADLSAVTQLRRYVEKIQKTKGLSEPQVKGVLAAPRITPNAALMLADWGFTFATVEPPKYKERFNKAQQNLTHF